MEFVFVTGMSGAGKTQVIKILEDLGYYCMDNVPPVLLSKFVELCVNTDMDIEKVAVGIDIRAKDFFDSVFQGLYCYPAFKDAVDHKILFLDAMDNVLLRRYKEQRRPHPLSKEGGLTEGINAERKIMDEVKKSADYIIDTSNFTLADLKDEINKIFHLKGEVDNLTITIYSFGFKHGLLLDGDLIFDVRFLPNPYYVSELRNFSGMDNEVKEYIFSNKVTEDFMSKLIDFVKFLIPNYIKEGKTRLIIGIGCTGGRHRSVLVAEELKKTLIDSNYRVNTRHRDLME